MALDRSELTTGTAKTSGTTLVSAAQVTIQKNSGIEIWLAYDNSAGLPSSVKLNDLKLERIRSTSSATSGMGIAQYAKPQMRVDRTGFVTATWSSAIGARNMVVNRVRGTVIEDVGANNTYDTAATLVNTGFSGLPNYDECYASAAWATDTPVESFAGDQTGGFTAGPLVGTTGGGLDITMQTGYLYLPTAVDTRARLLNAVSSLWVCSLSIMRTHTQNSQGITPTDEALTDIKFDSLSLDSYDKVYAFNEALDRYEVFNVARADLPSPISNSENGWT